MKLTENIMLIIQSYHAMEIEAHNLQYLMGMRKDLSIKAFELGRKVANYKYKKEVSTAQRKSKFAKSKLSHLSNSNLGKAELQAEAEIELLRLTEARFDGLYMGTKIVLEQCNAVISSIQQDLSVLRLEYKNEA